MPPKLLSLPQQAARVEKMPLYPYKLPVDVSGGLLQTGRVMKRWWPLLLLVVPAVAFPLLRPNRPAEEHAPPRPEPVVIQGARPVTLPALPAPRAPHAHWAFQPIAKPPVPAVAKRAWVRNAVDAFILARLEKVGLE